jgi:nucleoside-diphosphate-sugar epimerase
MSGRVLVLGATGRFGAAAAEAFRKAGWSVTAQVRPGSAVRAPRGTQVLEAIDRPAVIEAARGMDIVVHALNPRYTEWHRLALPMAYSAIEAAEAAGATLMFPGNVYNYGAGMPAVIDETTPMHPTSRKGELRVMIEERMREASDRGVRTIILRAGDFFGGGRGSWLDLVIAKDLGRGRITYPGPFDVVHEWAYLPDLVAALVRLASVRERFGLFETFGFPGHAVTGRDFADAINKAVRRNLAVKPMSWWLIHTLRRIVPMSRELSEMAYLWQEPHRIAGAKLKSAIGEVPHTPLNDAVARALRDLRAVA